MNKKEERADHAFFPLSVSQGTACLFCDKLATREARVSLGNITSRVRCCYDETCGLMAIQEAESGALDMSSANDE
ncbi:MAG: hypothetical protein Q8P01_03645 [bacterium]|nr:hypothetical protein [bacterium]